MTDANRYTGTKQVDEELVLIDDGEILDSAETEFDRLQEEVMSEREARLRLAAEYENYRRRSKREHSEAAEKGKSELLNHLITIADDFDLAVEHLDGTSGQVEEGLQMIRRRFSDLLRANGVEPFESLGETFDPEIHEAFAVVSSEGTGSGKVQTEVRRGYFRNGKLFRPALVVVEK
jgi:molecular chaperone GrpE